MQVTKRKLKPWHGHLWVWGEGITALSLACLTPGMESDGSESRASQTIWIELTSEEARRGVSFRGYHSLFVIKISSPLPFFPC